GGSRSCPTLLPIAASRERCETCSKSAMACWCSAAPPRSSSAWCAGLPTHRVTGGPTRDSGLEATGGNDTRDMPTPGYGHPGQLARDVHDYKRDRGPDANLQPIVRRQRDGQLAADVHARYLASVACPGCRG